MAANTLFADPIRFNKDEIKTIHKRRIVIGKEDDLREKVVKTIHNSCIESAMLDTQLLREI